jgi:hypothetical protein
MLEVFSNLEGALQMKNCLFAALAALFISNGAYAQAAPAPKGPANSTGISMTAGVSNGLTGIAPGSTVWFRCNVSGNFRQGSGVPVAVSTDNPLDANTWYRIVLSNASSTVYSTAIAIITAASGTCWITPDAP